jgi:hypothetical protein
LLCYTTQLPGVLRLAQAENFETSAVAAQPAELWGHGMFAAHLVANV